MIQWKKVNIDDPCSSLPKDRQFLALWKGAICLCELDEDDDHFYLANQPATYRTSFKLHLEREPKVTHWCELERPEDY